MKTFLKWVLIISGGFFLLLVAAGLMFGSSGSGTSHKSQTDAPSTNTQTSETTNQKTEEPPAELIQVTAKELATAYDDNEAAADAKYKGKNLEVRGVIASIEKGMFDETNVMLVGKNEFLRVIATLDKSSEGAALELKKGQNITLTCTGNSEVAGMPVLADCLIKQ